MSKTQFWTLFFYHPLPDQKLQRLRAVFNAVTIDGWYGILGPKLTLMITQIMDRSNCLEKVVNVTARLLKCLFSSDPDPGTSNCNRHQSLQPNPVCGFYGTY